MQSLQHAPIEQRKERPSNWQPILTITLAVAVSLLGYKVSQLNTAVVMSPKVIIIDFMEHVESYGMDLSELELEERMEHTRTQIRTLQDAGYLVLNSDHVVAAPEYLYLPTEIESNTSGDIK